MAECYYEDPEIPFCNEWPPSYEKYYAGLPNVYGNLLGHYVPENPPSEDKCEFPVFPTKRKLMKLLPNTANFLYEDDPIRTEDLSAIFAMMESYVMHYQGKKTQRKFTVQLLDYDVFEQAEYKYCIDKWGAKFTEAKDFDPLIIERQSQLCGAAFPDMAVKKKSKWLHIHDYASIVEVFEKWMERFSDDIPLVRCLFSCHFDDDECKTLIKPKMPFYLLENPKALCVAAAGIFGLRKTRSGTPHTWFTKYIFGRTIFYPGLYYPLALVKWLKEENWKNRFIFEE